MIYYSDSNGKNWEDTPSANLRVFRPTSSFRNVSIAGEGLQILTNAQHSWPLSSGGS